MSSCKQINVLRNHLLPSLSYHLSSERVENGSLSNIYRRIKHFRRHCINTPDNAATPFFHYNRNSGVLAITRLSKEANSFTMSKATQPLSSTDIAISNVARCQLPVTITSVTDMFCNTNTTEFLSSSPRHLYV